LVDGKRVLIVDDHAIVRGIMRSLFESQGFEVWEAADGAEGVRKAEEVKPNLVILDLSMPVMNGLEAARALRSLVPDVPLLMFTNSDGKSLEDEAQSSGISAVAAKADGFDPLLKKANALLKTNQPR
jgi:CheY-like chemotaxis protein